ncbi:hypothetical protein PG996_006199 [Apiospora saccharicola]|uniref:Uncharacterized protein n=1 Tax=Apiospora saccharicola TaxID=335842 RepID=A0ABR1VNN0_9PEZI
MSPNVPMAPNVPIEDVKVLCYAMATCEDFKLNTKGLAPHIGIKTPNNCSNRRLHAILKPIGFELINGKIVAKDDSGSPDKNDDSADAPATPTPASKRQKKRKIEAVDDYEEMMKIEEELILNDEI